VDFEQYWNTVRDEVLTFASTYGLQLVGALVIAVVGWIVAAWLAGRVRRLAEASDRVDETLVPVLTKLTRTSVLAVVLVAVLDNLGVDTASVIAFLGAAGLAIGLALKDTASDVAAGITILILRPIAVGEYVMIGSTGGQVDEIGIFQTRLTSFEGVPIVLNNAHIRTSEIQNFTRAEQRRIDLTIGIAYGADVDRGIEVIREVVSADERLLAEPEPIVDVENLGESSVDLLVRVWCAAPDYIPTKLALGRRIKQALDARDIPIPFPQREVRILSENAA
jgi:small conductance mechanosensitive channel